MKLFVFYCFQPRISLSVKGRPRQKCPKNPVFRDFLPEGVRQNVKRKKLVHLGEKILGRPDFPPKSAPIAFFFFRPSPGIHPSAKGRPRPKSRILRFPARGGLVGQNVKKLRTTIPEGVVTFFSSISGPLAPGNCVYRLHLAPSFSLSAKGRPGPKRPKFPVFFAITRPWGSGSAKGKP